MHSRLAQSMEVCVLVLGDVGRSPRMQYHCTSLLQLPALSKLHLVGYFSSPLIPSLTHNPKLVRHHIAPFPITTPNTPKTGIAKICKILMQIPFAGLKTLWMLVGLSKCMFLHVSSPRMQYMLVQNPPAIPTLIVAHWFCWTNSVRLVIDWHNFAYTILALGMGHGHPLVSIAKLYEQFFGRGAWFNFCVTQAMRDELQWKWDVKAQVLYDKPPVFFQRISGQEVNDLFSRMYEDVGGMDKVQEWLDKIGFKHSDPRTWKDDVHSRPALLITSTSYTKDEDISVLLSALEDLDSTISHPILVFVTGKGPLMGFYAQQISSLNERMGNIMVLQVWLKSDEYPRLLGACDLGVSLHGSSSGFDLPMKVVDMFGCQLPVCAKKFNCINELVEDGVNGLIFDDSDELSQQLKSLIGKFPYDKRFLDTLQKGVCNSTTFKIRWNENWKNQAESVFVPFNASKGVTGLGIVLVTICIFLLVAVASNIF